jgi:hypothetical protein
VSQEERRKVFDEAHRLALAQAAAELARFEKANASSACCSGCIS